jgi:hypothetical protein
MNIYETALMLLSRLYSVIYKQLRYEVHNRWMGMNLAFQINTYSRSEMCRNVISVYSLQLAARAVHIRWAEGDGRDLLSELRVGPKGTEMQFWG